MHFWGGGEDFCAIFEYLSAVESDRLLQPFPVAHEGTSANDEANDLDEAVLVGVVDLFEQIEGALAPPTSALVRLHRSIIA